METTLPVSMLSSTTALPTISTASHGTMQPLVGTMTTSPGTKSLVGTSRMSKIKNKLKYFCLLGALYSLDSLKPATLDGLNNTKTTRRTSS